MKALGFRNLLGLAAIGGGIYYMQKKRGGDMSFASIKNNLRGLVDDLLNKKSEGASSESANASAGVGNTTERTNRNEFGGSTGYGGSSYTGSGSGYGYGGGSNGGGTRH